MNWDESSKSTFSDLLAPLKAAIGKYSPLSAAPALAVLALVSVLALKLPDYFVSDSLIFIQPQRIASKIVEAPKEKEQRERLEALVQEMLSRPRLRSIIEQFRLYPDYTGSVGKEKALRKFREAIELAPVQSKTSKDRLSRTFRLSYWHKDAGTAYEVTKALANLFIEESLISRRSETRGTEEFLEAQLKAAKQKLEKTEALVSDFVRKNYGKLPEHLDHAIARLENSQSQLTSNTQLITANLTRLAHLKSELAGLTKAATLSSAGGAADDPYQSLDQLQSSLVVLRSKYSERHPDIINTKKRIDALKKRIREANRGTKGVPRLSGRNGEYARRLRQEINEVNIQITALRQENKALKASINKRQENIEAMPLQEQELVRIKREYESVKNNFERLVDARERARIQSSMVRSAKGAQFRIVEPPSVPVIPAGPNRYIVAAAGVFAALFIFAFIPLSAFFMNGSFKFQEELEDEIDLPVVGIIPPMDTPESVSAQRRNIITTMIASLVAVVVGTGMIFFLT